MANEGVKPTFISESYGSILDLTLVSENVVRNIKQCTVLDDEILSDHNYVTFEVSNSNNTERE